MTGKYKIRSYLITFAYYRLIRYKYNYLHNNYGYVVIMLLLSFLFLSLGYTKHLYDYDVLLPWNVV